jgi:hypothetical protein
MKRKRKDIKRRHNGKDRQTGKRLLPKPFAYEPRDGEKKGKTNRKDLSEKEQKAFDKKAERKLKREQHAEQVRQKYLALRNQEHEPCCGCDEARDAKNAYLLRELKAIRCDTVVDEITGVKMSNIIPRGFENRQDVRKHMSHFAPFARANGYHRHWR